MSFSIQPYNPEKHLQPVYSIWQETLGVNWTLGIDTFNKVIRLQRQTCGLSHYIASLRGEVIGFASACVRAGEETKGEISLIMVKPDFQNRGVGSALYGKSLDHFIQHDCETAHVGIGSPRFWPGVPVIEEKAVRFFSSKGWKLNGGCYDMVQHVSGYQMPKPIKNNPGVKGVAFRTISPNDADAVLEFAGKEFPFWLNGYQEVIELEDYDDILVGIEGDRIVAGIILYSPLSHPLRTDAIWQEVLGYSLGSYGCVGVAANQRGRGLGLLLCATASETLASRGVENCFISWTGIKDFYAKLGAKVWREYLMGTAPVSELISVIN